MSSKSNRQGCQDEMMTDEQWNVRNTPYQHHLHFKRFFETEARAEALSRLLFLVEDCRSCGLMFGPTGSGKSLLLQQCVRILKRSQREIAFVDAHSRNGTELLWDLCGEFGLAPRYAEDVFVLRRRLVDHLTAQRGNDFPTVLVIDHANAGIDDCTDVVSRLIQMSQHHSGTTILLSIRANYLDELPLDWREATDLRVELPWLKRNEAERFVHEFTSAVPGNIDFCQDAIDLLLARSHGSPRTLSQLCELSLLTALIVDEQHISARSVLQAVDDLQCLGYHEASENLNRSIRGRNTSVDV